MRLSEVMKLWRDAAEVSLELAPLELLSELLSGQSSASTPNILAIAFFFGRSCIFLCSFSWTSCSFFLSVLEYTCCHSEGGGSGNEIFGAP